MGKFDKNAANKAVKFFEKYLKHTKGEHYGKPFKLAKWQKEEIIKPLFGTLNEDGTRQHRLAFVEVPKKNGKSEIAAGVALYLLFADNEPGAEIYGAAADREQASIVYRVARDMILQSPELMKRCTIRDSTKRIVLLERGSFYHALSAEAFRQHGVNASGIIFDELHTQRTRELWDTLRYAGDTRRQPLIFSITTAGFDKTTICYEQHDYAQKVLDSTITDPTYFAYIRTIDNPENWHDENEWFKANPALGDFLKLDAFRAAYQEACNSPSKLNAFLRLRLNVWTSSYSAWMPTHKWDECNLYPIDEQELEGKRCYAGLDLSSKIDITALSFVFPPQEGLDKFVVLSEFFVPEETVISRTRDEGVPYDVWVRDGYIHATPGNTVDYEFIENRFKQAIEKYQIPEFAFDVWNATYMAQNLEKDHDIEPIPFAQNARNFSGPMKELEKLVLEKNINHGGNPVLRWMASNVQAREDANLNIMPNKKESKEKIDGMVALMMALDRARRHIDEESVYETRGIVAI